MIVTGETRRRVSAFQPWRLLRVVRQRISEIKIKKCLLLELTTCPPPTPKKNEIKNLLYLLTTISLYGKLFVCADSRQPTLNLPARLKISLPLILPTLWSP